MSMDQLREFVSLYERKAALALDLRRLESRIAALREPIEEFFISNQVDHVRVGGKTVYLHRQLRASYGDQEADLAERRRQAVVGLREAGLGDLVFEGCDLNSVSAWFREQEREHGMVPEVPGFKVAEVVTPRVRG